MKKKVISLMLIGAMVASMAACGSNGGSSDNKAAKGDTSATEESGASEGELDALQNQIIETEYRHDPIQMQRMLVLAELEPYRHLTRPEVLELYEKQLITEDELRIKLNFANFVRRFERENTNVLEFGSQIPFSKKIEVITNKFYDYASESRNRG